MKFSIHNADVLDALREMPDESFDACFNDPPYGLSSMRDEPEKILRAWLGDADVEGAGGFMGRAWIRNGVSKRVQPLLRWLCDEMAGAINELMEAA